MEEKLSKIKSALSTIITVDEGYVKRVSQEALDVINQLQNEVARLRYDNAEKKLQIRRVGQNIMNTSEECGKGVLFYNRMRKYATDLMEAYNDDNQ